MEGLLVILGLATLGIPFAVVYLLVSHGRVKREVAALREHVSALQARIALQDGAPLSPLPQPSQAERIEDAGQPAPSRPQPASNPWERVAQPASGSAGAPTDKTVAASATEQPAPAGPPRAVVIRRENLKRLGAWLAANWFYAVSAASLALAGIFLVQYGVENGLLPPPVRVLAALAMGAALIVAGEVIRRRFGDDEDATTAYLPSVFSGAGIVTLFGGVLSARLLYGLIGAETALAGMVAVALVGLVLGWFHGPLLAAVGILGAFAAPFVVGGSSEDPSWLYGYFAVIAALGLGIDTVRRWAWITVLTLVLGYCAGGLVVLGASHTAGGYGLFLVAVLTMSVLLPVQRLVPDHDGTMIAEALVKIRQTPWPEFPTRVAFLAMLASSGGLVWISAAGAAEFWLSSGMLTAIALVLIVWSRNAPALQDVALIPVTGLLATIAWQGGDRMETWRLFHASYDENPEADFPLQVTILLAMAAAVSVLSLWRALASRGTGSRFALVWAAVAALTAPLAAMVLELAWTPAVVIGPYPWALHAAAVAVLMVFFAERLARVDGPEDRLRMSLPVLSALSAMAFAFTILFAETALTLAFVATVVTAAALDRAFRMPSMTVFITLGVAAIGYRLVADPGLDFGLDGPLAEVIAVYGGALAGFIAALTLVAPLSRPAAKTVLDSAAWSVAGLLVSLLLFRWLETLSGDQEASHWAMGLYATIWLGLMAAQLQRLVLGGWLRFARIALAAVFGLIGFGALGLGLSLLNPVLSDWSGDVLGPPVLNTLAVGYLLPALLLLAIARRIDTIDARIRIGFAAVAVGLVVFWVFAVIRHFWQGAAGMPLDDGITQPELYSYTVALLLAGAALFYQSLSVRSAVLRRVGLAVIALAVAKVFLVDAAGLTGLTRVFSFLLLGLALAGLAWLGQWAGRSHEPRDSDPAG
ncbi:DUF2339 domain-containing protein [Thalassococcus sp. CAU 1522]|uniref:DUF2339 domain-containing protein n=1 Tax=Thalassococcus arenae TaxID=2851652 RepID=A0ABS6N5E2_9RHOB|nr:DUF2339 domain-containing protein [Thalassococcus arenae]MBV2359227.1 DUF2339 domain-containing protein [Thalassococcus arenae]